MQWLLDDWRGASKGHLSTGIFGTRFALDALSREGHAQAVYDAVGFDRIVIRPQLVNGVEWVRSRYRSVRGEIVSNWARAPGSVEWQVTVPANATARVSIPAGAIDQVKEGRGARVPARRAEGVRDARMDGRDAVFTVGSGSYVFVSRPPAR